MVKTPRTRHSKTQRAPVTIELGSDDVKRVDEPIADAPAEPEIVAPVESIEVPAQPDAELQKVEGEPVAEETKTEKAEQSASGTSDYSFGRANSESPTSRRSTPVKQGGMSSLAAGVIGAVLALGGLYGLQAAGVVGSPGSTAAAPSLEPLESQIAALKSELDGLKSAPAAVDSGVTSALDQIKSDVASLQSAVQTGGAGDGAAVAALDERIKKLETAPAQDVDGKIAAVESKVTAAADSLANSDTRIGTLEQSLGTLADKVEQQASQPKVALAIAATALKSAVDRGGPFAAEAETFAAIAPNAPELAALRQYADQGVATVADLVASFPQSADAMIAASQPEDPNAGVLQRLLDSAQSVVKVRPVGSVAGDDPGARIARMEVALKAGDLQNALTEYDGLPEAAKQAGAALADRIKARIEVTKLVDQLVANAMKSA